jgi:hypothetical protein
MANQMTEVSSILQEWSGVKARLEELFHERNHENTRELMQHGIGLFVQFLYLSNGKTVSSESPIPLMQFDLKPVNIEERFAFIKSRPSLFHSFRQLSELMVEQEKMFVKNNIIKKSSKPKA